MCTALLRRVLRGAKQVDGDVAGGEPTQYVVSKVAAEAGFYGLTVAVIFCPSRAAGRLPALGDRVPDEYNVDVAALDARL